MKTIILDKQAHDYSAADHVWLDLVLNDLLEMLDEYIQIYREQEIDSQELAVHITAIHNYIRGLKDGNRFQKKYESPIKIKYN